MVTFYTCCTYNIFVKLHLSLFIIQKNSNACLIVVSFLKKYDFYITVAHVLNIGLQIGGMQNLLLFRFLLIANHAAVSLFALLLS